MAPSRSFILCKFSEVIPLRFNALRGFECTEIILSYGEVLLVSTSRAVG